MASLINRLKSLQEETPVELTDLSGLTLAELSKEKIAFGQKHMGETFETAWEDQMWINFMVTKYGSSKVLAHRKLIKFVELKVEAHEKHKQAIPIELKVEAHEKHKQAIPILPPRESRDGYTDETSDHSGSKYIQPKAKVRPSGRSHEPPILVDGDEELEFEMYNSGTMDQPPLSQDPDFQAMQQRLLHMEDALTKVIRHLEDKTSEQSQP